MPRLTIAVVLVSSTTITTNDDGDNDANLFVTSSLNISSYACNLDNTII